MEPTFEDGWDAAIHRFEASRRPLDFAEGESFPPVDVALSPLKVRYHRARFATANSSSYARKQAQLGPEFDGLPQILFLHALTIAALKRRDWPPSAPKLFLRLWQEEGEYLMGQLNSRWLIAAAVTFADHGTTEAQRQLGQSAKILFSLLKLTEFERLYSGQPPNKPFRFADKVPSALPLGMDPVALRHSGLELTMIVPMVQIARHTPLVGPIVLALLDRLNHDPGTVFRRLKRMRLRLETNDPLR